MAHTTSIYYRDRLGFEPDYEPTRQHASKPDGSGAPGRQLRDGGHHNATSNNGDHHHGGYGGNMPGGVYEENLNKFKGTGGEGKFVTGVFFVRVGRVS